MRPRVQRDIITAAAADDDWKGRHVPRRAGPGRAGRGGLPLHGDVTAGDVASPSPGGPGLGGRTGDDVFRRAT